MDMWHIAAVAGGGAVGALLRAAAGELTTKVIGGPHWAGTLAVNLAGCFLIGVVWRACDHHSAPEWVRIAVITGGLGALTTFSAFGMDAWTFAVDRRFAALVVYVLVSVVIGIALVAAGVASMQWLIRLRA